VRIFISYAREDATRVEELRDNLTEAGHDVWFDQDVRGGEQWWDLVLERIRWSDIVTFALSPDSVTSRACRREMRYAAEVNRRIVPITIRKVSIEEGPDQIQLINAIALIDPQIGDWMRLMTTIQQTPPADPLPDPLPAAPDAPIADLAHAREMSERSTLTGPEQKRLVDELGEAVREDDDRQAVVAVLQLLRQRSDLLEVVADEIDNLLLNHPLPPDRDVSPLVRSLVADLKKHRCTPILGSGMTDWLFGSRRDLAQRWASEYPFQMTPHWSDDLPQITQYAAITYSDLVLRDELDGFYREQIRKRYPTILEGREGKLSELVVAVWEAEAPLHENEPHTVLAQLPCPIYVTAQATTLLVRALEDAGKKPVTDFCRWKEDLVGKWPSPFEDPTYVPSPEQPLVYHVLGTLDVPESIVITEDEYFDFLAAVARSGSGSDQLIPPAVEEALANTSLLFLGFGLQDWDLRILLRSVIMREAKERKGQKAKHVAADLDILAEGVRSPEDARDYIVRYFRENEPSIEIEWASVDEFASDLARAWKTFA
jgi:hypothetical protein